MVFLRIDPCNQTDGELFVPDTALPAQAGSHLGDARKRRRIETVRNEDEAPRIISERAMRFDCATGIDHDTFRQRA